MPGAVDEILKGKGVDPEDHYEVEPTEDTPHADPGGAAAKLDPFNASAAMDGETRARLTAQDDLTEAADTQVIRESPLPDGVVVPAEESQTEAALRRRREAKKGKPEKSLGDQIKEKMASKGSEVAGTTESKRMVTSADGEGAERTPSQPATSAPTVIVKGPGMGVQERTMISCTVMMYSGPLPEIKFAGFWRPRDVRMAAKHMWKAYRLYRRDLMKAGKLGRK